MINQIDDLPAGCIYSIKMLRDIFANTEFEILVNQSFLEAYNQVKTWEKRHEPIK